MAVDVSELRREVLRFADRVHERASRELLIEQRAEAPVLTGATRLSGRLVNRRRSTSSVSVRLEFTTPQAEWTDKGTRPHVIRPRRGNVLRFRVGNQIVFARRVNHPGFRGTGWFTKRVTAQRWRALLQRAAGFVR